MNAGCGGDRRRGRTARSGVSYGPRSIGELARIEAATLKEGLSETATPPARSGGADLGLPDGDGIELVRSMRAWSSSPILVLSARGEEKDKIQALDTGADDYLTKPFGIASCSRECVRWRDDVRGAMRASRCFGSAISRSTSLIVASAAPASRCG